MNETWKPIIDWEEWYEVSDMGRVRSLDRVIEHPCNPRRKGKILNPKIDSQGYYFVILCKNKYRKHRLLARIVAEHFIPNPENKPTVNHKKGNKLDNRATELEWATLSENAIHAYDTGLCNRRLLTLKQAAEIRALYKNGLRIVHLSELFHVGRSVVQLILLNRTYKSA